SAVAVVFTAIYLIARRVISFKDAISSLPKGFCAMVSAILILCFAWTLNGVTGTLGAAVYVRDLMAGAAEGLTMLLPAIIFLVACFLAFATGTSWGTFGILIPIVTAIFEAQIGADGTLPELMVIGISACLAGAVCGDHCSPISDTTIMASAGAQCNHVNHVSTQLPYALTVAAVSFVSFIIAGFVQSWYICLPISVVLMVGTLVVIKMISAKADGKAAKKQ
ncbi:MAG: Na+/H+ antiporter NhaC family protein, partial [Clostridia bacterium]|nr:Na+/H+ antiporter NhaC family protein [Clostridia bacterium]